jgi:hypothetical protein
MIRKMKLPTLLAVGVMIIFGFSADVPVKQRLTKYTEYTLQTDLSHLNEQELEMLGHLIEVSKIMDDLFWKQAYGDKEELMRRLRSDDERAFARINYGPWDRLAGNEPWLRGAGPKPLGANFYPANMTKEEFDALEDPQKTSLYTLIRRDSRGKLVVVPYHVAYEQELQRAAQHLRAAAELTPDDAFRNYLMSRAYALERDQYQESDFKWMYVKDSNVDFVVGAIENYEDRLFGYKAAYEAFVLIKDHEWSSMLQRFNDMLPEMQMMLPVADEYKQEMPGTDADINVYDAIYYAGDCNAGSKSIAINLPNDEEVHLRVGSRKLQLKNSMQAKFDKILIPISEVVIAPSQRHHVTFNAFFTNTMFHEIAHGMGIKNVLSGEGTVREALREAYSPIEENKADVLGLWLVSRMLERGELEGDIMDYYVTFMAGIFRSSRFGAASAHGKANMMRYRYLQRAGAFVLDDKGFYSVNPDAMREAIEALTAEILMMQGKGDYHTAAELVLTEGTIPADLQRALDSINRKGIPVDIVFNQGYEVLGLRR